MFEDYIGYGQYNILHANLKQWQKHWDGMEGIFELEYSANCI